MQKLGKKIEMKAMDIARNDHIKVGGKFYVIVDSELSGYSEQYKLRAALVGGNSRFEILTIFTSPHMTFHVYPHPK